MAGDWIKVRDDLVDDPAVLRIAGALKLDRYAVVGRLVAIWTWADRQSRDGHAAVPHLYLDDLVNTPGIADAMLLVGWLEVPEAGRVVFPNFERHNGKSAKKRALATRRKQDQRTRESVTLPSRARPQRGVTREEKSLYKHPTVTNSTARSDALRTPVVNPSPPPPRTASSLPDSVRGVTEHVHRTAASARHGSAPFREHADPRAVTLSRDALLAEAQRKGIDPLDGEAASALAERVHNAPEPPMEASP